MGDVATQFPDKTIQIEGLAWHQGFNDRVDIDAADVSVYEYEANLNDLIADLRSALNAPDMKVVIGTTGMGSDALFDPAQREPWYYK